MSGRTASKLNQLLQQLPRGAVATQTWLSERGVYRQLASRYATSGWLERFGTGAYSRAGDEVDWLGGVYSLQQQLGLGVHVAAETALSLKGLGQYLPMGNRAPVFLFSNGRETLPAWFRHATWNVTIRHHCPNLFDPLSGNSLTDLGRGTFSVAASGPERAMLETMYLTNGNGAVVHALELMNGLATLRPNMVQQLLEGCRSVKVKRLFLWAAERTGHAWFSRLSLNKVDLGRGKRVIYRGGRFDAKYLITVPPPEEMQGV